MRLSNHQGYTAMRPVTRASLTALSYSARVVWLLATLFSVVFQTSAIAASSAPQSQNGEGLQIVLEPIWPNLVRQVVRRSAPRDIRQEAVRSIPLRLSDPKVMGPLLLEMAKVRARKAIPELEKCETSRVPFSTAIRRLADALDWLKVPVAEANAREAWLALYCSTQVIAVRELAEFYFLNGVLESLQERDPRPFFTGTVVLSPDYPSPEQYSTTIQSAFESAREEVSGRARANVVVDPKLLQSFEVWIDGSQADRTSVALTVGSHLIQLRPRGGSVLASWIVTLTRAKAEPYQLQPTGFVPPTEGEMLSLLTAAVSARQAGPELTQVLLGVLQGGDHPWMVLVAGGQRSTHDAQALWILSSELQVAGETHCALPPFCEARGPGWTSAAGGLALTTLTATGVYGYAALRMRLSTPSEPLQSGQQAQTLLALQRGARVVAGLSLLGTTLLASYSWRVPVGLYSHSYPAPDLTGGVHLTANQQSVALELEVFW